MQRFPSLPVDYDLHIQPTSLQEIHKIEENHRKIIIRLQHMSIPDLLEKEQHFCTSQ